MNRLVFIFILTPIILFAQNNRIKDKDFFKELTKEEIRIIVNRGTERAFSGIYNNFYKEGIYACKACNNPLFTSKSKFKSNCGWPSFDDEIRDALIRKEDNSYGMIRVEICCANCKGHLGHVFEGEDLTEKNIRHCVNSISLKFIKDDQK